MSVKGIGSNFGDFDDTKLSNLSSIGSSNFSSASSNFAKPESADNTIPSKEDTFSIEIKDYNDSSKSSYPQPVTQMPQSIATPPKNGVSKTSLDGAVSYKKEVIKEIYNENLPQQIMDRETIEYDDGTVITHIYEGGKLVKSIEENYSGDPRNPKPGDTINQRDVYYRSDGSVEEETNHALIKAMFNEDIFIGWCEEAAATKFDRVYFDEEGNAVTQLNEEKWEKMDQKLLHATLYAAIGKDGKTYWTESTRAKLNDYGKPEKLT